MRSSAEVVVIGGGVIGASVAFHLAKMGARDVVLVEKQGLASGPTGRSMGIIRQHYSNEVTARLVQRSMSTWQHFADVVGGQCGFVVTGYLVLGTERDRPLIEYNVALQRGVGIDTGFIPVDEAQRLEPRFFYHDVTLAVYEPGSGYADPTQTTTAYAAAARRLGVEVCQETEVIGFEVAGGRVLRVETTQGPIACGSLVSAAGCWSRQLLAQLGVDLPLHVGRSRVFAFGRRGESARRDHPTVADFANLVSFRPETGGLTLAGDIDPAETVPEVDPDNYRGTVSLDEAAVVAGKASQRMPEIEAAAIRPGWAGAWDITPDWHPVLDRLPGYDNVVCAAGFSGHGFKLAPAVGEQLAQLVTRGATEIDLRRLRFARFAEGDLVRGKYGDSVIG